MDRRKRQGYESYGDSSLLQCLMLFGVALPFIVYLSICIFLQKLFALWPIGLSDGQVILLRMLKKKRKEFLETENLVIHDDGSRLARAALSMEKQIQVSELEDECINAGIAEWRIQGSVS
ncbi:MAG: hypothetical protein AAB847_01960 [Patescibacteria group bacterium]